MVSFLVTEILQANTRSDSNFKPSFSPTN